MTTSSRKSRPSRAQETCVRCDSTLPPSRRKYCGDKCYQAVHAAQGAAHRISLLDACKRCGGAKEGGVRGAKYCAECRRVIADQASAYEAERTRRRVLAEREARISAGTARRLPPEDGMKWCARCQNMLPTSSFSQSKSGRGVRVIAYCVPCTKSYNAERRIKIKFGLTWDEYDAIYQSQGGRCAICDGKPRKYMLAVDHDHKTGEVRGLLCSRCNHRLLGSANDDPARLRKAADYLERFAPRQALGRRHAVPGYGDPDPEATP